MKISIKNKRILKRNNENSIFMHNSITGHRSTQTYQQYSNDPGLYYAENYTEVVSMKKKSSFLLTMVLIFSVCIVLPSWCIGDTEEIKETTINDIKYSYHLLDDGTAELLSVGLDWDSWEDWPEEKQKEFEQKEFQNVIIPEKVDNYTVSSIADGRTALSLGVGGWRASCNPEEFAWDIGIITLRGYSVITIPDSVTSVKGNPFVPFGFENVSDFVLSPDHPTLEVIDGFLFEKKEKKLIAAPRISDVCVIPEGTRTIGEYAMGQNSVTQYIFPESLTTIEDYALGCNNTDAYFIKPSVIPDSVTEIGTNPFAGYPSFYQKSWYGKRVEVSPDHPTLEIVNDCLISKKDHRLITFNSDATKCVIPEGVEIIDHNAFEWMHRLKSIVIPEGVKAIKSEAFHSCGISKFVLPSSLMSIGSRAFSYLELTSIELPYNLTEIGDEAFDGFQTSLTVTVTDGSYAQRWIEKHPTFISYNGQNSAKDHKEKYKIKVIYRVAEISLDKTEISLQKNKAASVKATILPKNAKNKKVEWISTNPDVATVNNSGRIKGIAAGTCDIICRALDGGKVEAVCHVIVVEEDQ